MQLSISEFLSKAATAETVAGIREMLRAEKEKYAGMQHVLRQTETPSPQMKTLLTQLEEYLQNLQRVEQKLRQPALTLFAAPGEDPAINRQLLEILSQLYRQ